jgi:hypothetical protein
VPKKTKNMSNIETFVKKNKANILVYNIRVRKIKKENFENIFNPKKIQKPVLGGLLGIHI